MKKQQQNPYQTAKESMGIITKDMLLIVNIYTEV